MIDTVILPLAGGALIGVAAAALWTLNGRIAGISGIVGGALGLPRRDLSWRFTFVVGLIAGGVLLELLRPSSFPESVAADTPVLIAAGLLVGLGTRLGSGCTSGHGVCGMARLSRRSFAATGTFIFTGAVTVLLARLIGGGA